MIRTATLFLAALLLSSCGYNTDAMLRQSVGYECVEAEGEVGGFLCAENGQPAHWVKSIALIGQIQTARTPLLDRAGNLKKSQPTRTLGPTRGHNGLASLLNR